MKEITEQELEYALGQMRALKKSHPKAKVIFDPERNGVIISYPLPKNLLEISKMEFKEL